MFTDCSTIIIDSQMCNVYKDIIKLFLSVMLNQFRKYLLDSFKVEKKMSHRKQIRVSTCKSKSPKSKAKASKSKTNKNEITQKDASSASIDDTTSLPSSSPTVVQETEEDNTKCKVCATHDKETLWI